MTKKLILFAQEREARATLRETKAEPIPGITKNIWSEGEMPSCYRYEGGLIVLTNVGVHNAQMAAAYYAHEVDEIWNLGMAGALNPEHHILKVLPISIVGKFTHTYEDLDSRSRDCMEFIYPPVILGGGNGRLISSDFAIHHQSTRDRLAKSWDVVDMEGYGIAFAAQYLAKKCCIWKIVSDFASPGGRVLMTQYRDRISEMFAEVVLSESSLHHRI